MLWGRPISAGYTPQAVILYYLESFDGPLLAVMERRRMGPDFCPVVYAFSPRYAGSLYRGGKLGQRYYASNYVGF
jgi:hypothetical protein